MSKVAIILQAGPGSHESDARMFHSLVYSKELHERHHDVRLIFDGASTEWLAKWGDPADDDDRRIGDRAANSAGRLHPGAGIAAGAICCAQRRP